MLIERFESGSKSYCAYNATGIGLFVSVNLTSITELTSRWFASIFMNCLFETQRFGFCTSAVAGMSSQEEEN